MERILITGRSKFLGYHLSKVLYDAGIDHRFNDESTDLTLSGSLNKEIDDYQPTGIIHLATKSGNVQYNQTYPATTFLNTSLMNLNVLKTARDYQIKKTVSVLSSCCIADMGDTVLKEEHLHAGPPNPSIESHGYAKRLLDIGSRQLRKQYDMNAVTCILQNLYGPRDSLDLSKTKVVMALIKRFVDAKDKNIPNIELWGSGIARREFVYVEDAAKALLQVYLNYNDDNPVNIASDVEITIRELAHTIKFLVGYTGQIVWLTEKGDGQLRKKLDTTKMHQYLDLQFTPLEEGLKETIKWYQTIR